MNILVKEIKIYNNIQNFVLHILEIGTKNSQSIVIRQRIVYFNAILFVLPIVYFIFFLMDLKSYFKPLNNWYFDQYSFFIFILICLFCLYLNSKNKADQSKVLFLILWPLVLQMVPIVIQATPNDYYYAFPMGIIFHSVLIHIVFSKKKSPWLFWTFLSVNFLIIINCLKILWYFDTNGKSNFNFLANDQYYVLDMVLYWLLFNLMINYLLRIIDSNILKMLGTMQVIEKQKNDLEDTLERLQQSNTQIIRSEKMTSLGILTAGVSHEINNPLNFIQSGLTGISEYLDELNKEKPENLSFFLSSMQEGIARISNIVSSLGHFSKNNISYSEEYNIHSILDNCLGFLNNKTEQRIEIKKNYFTQPISMMGNTGELHQLFINILSNSIQSIENEGIISIKTQNLEDHILIEISDSGCGISEENIPKITDPFFTTKDPGKGTGLGLSIVYRIIQDHNGTLEFQSDINKGTVVTIILPI